MTVKDFTEYLLNNFDHDKKIYFMGRCGGDYYDGNDDDDFEEITLKEANGSIHIKGDRIVIYG